MVYAGLITVRRTRPQNGFNMLVTQWLRMDIEEAIVKFLTEHLAAKEGKSTTGAVGIIRHSASRPTKIEVIHQSTS